MRHSGKIKQIVLASYRETSSKVYFTSETPFSLGRFREENMNDIANIGGTFDLKLTITFDTLPMEFYFGGVSANISTSH